MVFVRKSTGALHTFGVGVVGKILIALGFLGIFFVVTPRLFGSVANADTPSSSGGGSGGSSWNSGGGGGPTGDDCSSCGACSCSCEGAGCGTGSGCGTSDCGDCGGGGGGGK